MKDTYHRNFGDIIMLPHHISPTRPQMRRIDRAAQFAPFAALTGYDASIRETARLTQPRIELSEDQKAELDRRQELLITARSPQLQVTYFVPDKRKDGGRYVTHTGTLKRIIPELRVLLMEDGTVIGLDDVLELGGPLFQNCTVF